MVLILVLRLRSYIYRKKMIYRIITYLLIVAMVPIIFTNFYRQEKRIWENSPPEYKTLYHLLWEREKTGLYDYRKRIHDYRRKFMEKKLSKKEIRALHTLFTQFPALKKSQNALESEIQTGDLVIITGNTGVDLCCFYFLGSFCLYFGFGLIYLHFIYPIFTFELNLVMLIIASIIIGMGIGTIVHAICRPYFFIIVDSQGIYYKKYGKPRAILWDEVHIIEGYRKRSLIIRIKLKSKLKIRFHNINYHFEHKFLEFYDIIRTFKHIPCPFFGIPSFITFKRFSEFLQIAPFNTREIIHSM